MYNKQYVHFNLFVSFLIQIKSSFCSRYFAAASMYFCLILVIISGIMISVADKKTWKEVQNIQFYSDDGYIASIYGKPQMSTQVAFNVEKAFVNPQKIYIESIPKTVFYECYNKKLNYANWNQMTVNQSYHVYEKEIFIPYNGIGDWCVDSTTTVTFETSGRQPFHPQDNKNKYCYDNMQENVLVTFDQITERDQITYVTYNTKYDGLCRKMSDGKVEYADSTIVGYKKASKDEDYITNGIKIQSFNPQWENSFWTYIGFTVGTGVIFIGCLIYLILVGVYEKDWNKAFLFKQ